LIRLEINFDNIYWWCKPLTPRYSWNIAKVGIKQQSINQFFFTIKELQLRVHMIIGKFVLHYLITDDR